MTELIKCSRCRCNKILSHFETNKNTGKLKKSCKICLEKAKNNREKNRCPHGRQKNLCKDCGGSHICEHGRQKYMCKECGGTSICEHGRQKHMCKECCGTSICGHGRQKHMCKECGGSQICEHGKVKNFCKDCDGTSICEHRRQKHMCIECGGSQICEHNRERNKCKDCGGASICIHGRIRRTCKDCMSEEQKIEYIQKKMISHSRAGDKKYNRYDADHFIDKSFLEGLFEDSQNCHYCNVNFTYNELCDTFVTIERLNNSIGHIKSNCVLACWYCNRRHKSRDEEKLE